TRNRHIHTFLDRDEFRPDSTSLDTFLKEYGRKRPVPSGFRHGRRSAIGFGVRRVRLCLPIGRLVVVGYGRFHDGRQRRDDRPVRRTWHADNRTAWPCRETMRTSLSPVE